MESAASQAAGASIVTDVASVAIDGPAASGKTVVGGLVAERLGARFLDTGMMYRAVTAAALEYGVDYYNEDALTALAANLQMTLTLSSELTRVEVDGRDVTHRLRDRDVNRAVSPVSESPSVRQAMVARQRDVAAEGPIVMVGRDIGTAVLPDAGVKVYLDAPPQVRALRRSRDTAGSSERLHVDEVLREILERDRIDSERRETPLKPADDAVRINTGEMTIDEVVQRVLDLVTSR